MVHKIELASSYNNYWLVYVNGLQIARVRNWEEFANIKINDLRHEQLKELVKLSASDKNSLKQLLDNKNKEKDK